MITLETSSVSLGFDSTSGRLISFRPKAAPEQEFIAPSESHPVFAIQYLGEDNEIRELTSLDAEQVAIESEGDALVMEFNELAGMDLGATATVRATADDPMSRWAITVRNNTGRDLVNVQYPFIVADYSPAIPRESRRPGRPGTDERISSDESSETALLLPLHTGALIRNPRPQDIGPDYSSMWNLANPLTDHYPGSVFAQFLAFYTNKAGIYLACDDTAGHMKLMRAKHRDPGIRLGIAHAGDWPRNGTRTLDYEVRLGAFSGDWYAAAEIYRSWSLQQKWATPLHQRKDVPEWLLDSPPYITIRPQGVLDTGPIFPVEEFLPYKKAIPMLEKIADHVNAPLVAVIMGWERGGSWVYPDCFPPIGGDESVAEFARMARERGWHVGSFCNGTRWVISHTWNDYDGRAYYEQHNGEETVCRKPDGNPWMTFWPWRTNYNCCVGASRTREIATDFVQRLIGWGLESIQFFDQNVGAAAFSCFSPNHEHPPVPGRWMPEKMAETIAQFKDAARQAGEDGVVQSVEEPCNEYCLPLFQQCDVRVGPPSCGQDQFVPLYHCLFHECIIMHGMMGHGPAPYHLPIRNAYNGVLGEIPGAVMIGDGTLLNKNTANWEDWYPKVGNNDDALEMIRTVTALRRGPGKDFLVFGRMQAPSPVEGIETMRWEYAKQVREVPAVVHAAWQAPDGRFGVVLANWTTEARTVTVEDSRLVREVTVHTCGTELTQESSVGIDGRFEVVVPPLGCVLVEDGNQ